MITRAELKKIYTRHNKSLGQWNTGPVVDSLNDVTKLVEALEKAYDALAFYEHPQNWNDRWDAKDNPMSSLIEDDQGEIARKVLPPDWSER